MEKIEKPELTLTNEGSFVIEKKVEVKKKHRRRRKKVALTVKHNCSLEELRLILEELDSGRSILRMNDGRRLRRKLDFKSSKYFFLQIDERKIKEIVLKNFIDKSYNETLKLNESESIVLPIERALCLVELMASLKEETSVPFSK